MSGVRIDLRDYQTRGTNDIREAIRAGYRSILYVGPCGSGKTTLMKYIAYNAALKGNRTIFTVHRNVLLDQACQELRESGIEHGVIAAGRTMTTEPIRVASIATLARRLHYVKCPDVLVLDECSHATAKQWRKVIDAYPGAIKIGLTASPKRLSGEPLGDIFDHMILGPSVSDLIEKGYLSRFRIYAPPHNIDFSDVKKVMGDYEKGKIIAKVEKSKIVGSAVEHYKKHIMGERAIAFCVSIQASLRTAETFNKSGVIAQHIDGTTPKEDRRRIIKDFKENKINVLTNVDLIGEGFNIPSVKGVHLLRPTMSLALNIQQTGRALRPSPGKSEAIIFDHVGNCSRHGFPTDDFQWSLNGDEKGKKKPSEKLDPIRICAKCYIVFPRSMDICPNCKEPYKLNAREIKEVEGELQEIQRRNEWRAQRREQGQAQSLDALVKIGKSKGYKNPYFWARKVLEGRAKKQRLREGKEIW